MKKLSEFTSLSEARLYVTTRGRMASQDMIFHLLVKHSSMASLKESIDPNAVGFYEALKSGVKEFNLMDGNDVGEANKALLASLVAAGAVTGDFKTSAENYANPLIYPYEKVTLHEYVVATKTAETTPVTAADGWVKITVSDQVENHNPRLLAKSPRTGKVVRINSFYQVSTPGAYECLVPREWRSAELYVDNPYGVIS